MGMPLDYRIWAKQSLPAVYAGTFKDPAGSTACVFADPRSGRAIGPLNLRLGRKTGYTAPAPRVGAPPRAEPGRLGLLELYRVEWRGSRSGPDAEERGVFLRFEPGPESRDLAALAVDGLLLGLLAREDRLPSLGDPRDVERAQWGLILSRSREAALRHLAQVKAKLPKEAWHELSAATGLAFGTLAEQPSFRWKGGWPEAFHALRKGKPVPASALDHYEVAEPGVLRRERYHHLESCVEPDPEPFAPGPRDGLRFLRAAGADVYKAAMNALPGARQLEATALGFDATGRLAVAAPKAELLRWCSPEPGEAKFGDVLRLTLQDDRIAWAEPLGRNEAARAVDLLRADGSTRAKALLGEAGDVERIPEALAVNPSVEYARTTEKLLPGEGTSHHKLRSVLAAVAVYWRAGSFEDAWILLGRMPNLLPETKDAPVLRAARLLHRLLEGRHAHDATEEARNELSNVWDGTLSHLAEELGFTSRCAEVLDRAGL